MKFAPPEPNLRTPIQPITLSNHIPQMQSRRKFPLISAARALCLFAILALCSRAEEQVLFAFDDVYLPFQHGVKLNLISHAGAGNMVLGPGPAGAPDSKGLIYYGTVCEVNGELWMWYLGMGDQDEKRKYRICLAKSKDGRKWERPALGVVEYGGSKKNNLVDLNQGKDRIAGCVVYYEPQEKDPNKKFKMVYTGSAYPGLLFAVAYSPDGISWRESPNNPRGKIKLEPQGGIKWKDTYILNGQGGLHWGPENKWIRRLTTHVSYDFEDWTYSTVEGFSRDPIPPRPNTRTGNRDGEQVHLGAALWNRGNVIVGIYGQWHGNPTNDRRFVSIDSGLVVSHDALHFKEPIPDFRLIQAQESPSWWLPDGAQTPLVRVPALMQGQGFANVGKETLFWNSIWVIPSAGVRVARWERDRLGYLSPFVGPKQTPHVISCPLSTGGGPATISLNVSGIGENSSIKVTVLDEQFRPIPGYEAGQCTGPSRPGLREVVSWGDKKTITANKPIRLRVDFGGIRPEDVRLYAAYLSTEK